MGKTIREPNPAQGPVATDPSDAVLYVRGTAEQREKNQAALEWLRRREEEIAAMTEAEVQEEEREWEAFKHSMNQGRAGYRKLYVD